MSRGRLVRWAALGVGLLLCPLLSGCLAAGAAWPSVAITPPVQVSAGADQVHAFRVDVTDSDATVEFYEPSVYRLSEISVAARGWVIPQGKVSCDYGWFFGTIPLTYWKWKQHTVMVRLYRPGCQTVEVSAWTPPKEVAWRGVADLAGQEKAVDDLLSLGEADLWHEALDGDDKHSPFAAGRLADGSDSPEHRNVLLFAAPEYERLAKSAPDDPASRPAADRMREKAVWLRALADK